MQKSNYKPIPKEDVQFVGGNEHKLKKKTAKWLIKKYDAFADNYFYMSMTVYYDADGN